MSYHVNDGYTMLLLEYISHGHIEWNRFIHRKPVCKTIYRHRIYLYREKGRETGERGERGYPSAALRLRQDTHITQWAFYSIILAIPNSSSHLSLEICSTERLFNGCCFGSQQRLLKHTASSRMVSVTKERWPVRKVLLFFSVESTWCIIF